MSAAVAELFVVPRKIRYDVAPRIASHSMRILLLYFVSEAITPVGADSPPDCPRTGSVLSNAKAPKATTNTKHTATLIFFIVLPLIKKMSKSSFNRLTAAEKPRFEVSGAYSDDVGGIV